MKPRFVLHIILSLVLAVIGWHLYTELVNNVEGARDAIFVARYCFGFLVFFLFSWIFYWILRRRKTKVWIISLCISLAISIIATAVLSIIALQHEKQRQEALQNQELSLLN